MEHPPTRLWIEKRNELSQRQAECARLEKEFKALTRDLLKKFTKAHENGILSTRSLMIMRALYRDHVPYKVLGHIIGVTHFRVRQIEYCAIETLEGWDALGEKMPKISDKIK